MKHYGIADANGLESFKPLKFNSQRGAFEADPSELSLLVARAQANRHRHAVVFQVDLPNSSAKEIFQMLENGEYIEALIKLKEDAIQVELARMPGAEKSWKLIPNSILDPYSNWSEKDQ